MMENYDEYLDLMAELYTDDPDDPYWLADCGWELDAAAF